MAAADPSAELSERVSALAVTGAPAPLLRVLLAYWVAPPWNPHSERPINWDPTWPLRPPWTEERMVACAGLVIDWARAIDLVDLAAGAPGTPHLAERQAEAKRASEPAARELEEAIALGLQNRMWNPLAWPVFPSASEKIDSLGYRLIQGLRAKMLPGSLCARLYGPQPGGLSVCAGCTFIFRPRRKTRSATFCRLCSHRPAALGILDFERHPPHGRALLRRPVFESTGQLVGWNVASWGRCDVCNKPFGADNATARTCSDACRQADYRKRKGA